MCARIGSDRKHRLKRALFKRDGKKCCWCGKKLSYESATLEHLIPRMSPHGSNALWNLRLACAPCNHERGTKAAQPEMFRGASPFAVLAA